MRSCLRILAIASLAIPFLASSSEDPALRIQHPLSESALQQAIELGESLGKKSAGLELGAAGSRASKMRQDANRTNHWSQQTSDPMASTGFGVEVLTPFTWLSRGAQLAAKRGEPLSMESLDEAYLAPVVRVIGHANVPKNPTPGIYGDRVESIMLRSTQKKGYEELAPSETKRIPDEIRAPSGEILDMGPLVAAFSLEDFERISNLDKKGELHVVIVSEKGKEKKFKIKSKEFEKLP